MHCAHWVHISTGWVARVLDYQRPDNKGSGLSKAGLKSRECTIVFTRNVTDCGSTVYASTDNSNNGHYGKLHEAKVNIL